MKKIVLTIALALGLQSQMAFASRPTAILGPGMGGANFRAPYHETTNRVLSSDTTYILTGWYFVDSTYSITIPAGTLLRGDSASGGSLIIKRGAKIHATGTPTRPIIFTSNKPAGTRVPGDWGGVIILGSAPCNFGNVGNNNTVQVEGGFGSFPNTDALYGGSDPNDNSGELQYCRIEFAGIAFAPDNEINGLTLGGVGRGTKLDHIQTSFANDDDVEMFGGTVDLKYYIGWRMVDDDIDTDQGWSGRIQYAYEKRDPAIFDASAAGSSEGYESDGESPQFTTGGLNNGGPFNHYPHTSYRASNVTIVGPQSDTGVSVNSKWTVVARLRRGTRPGIYNSILVAYPQGINIRDTVTERYCAQDSLQIRYTSLQSKTSQITENSSPNTGNITGFNVADWFNGDNGYSNYHNYGGRGPRRPVDVGLRPEIFNLDITNNPVPLVGSEADTAGTSFQGLLAGDSFFDSVSYRGAFDPKLPRRQQWDWGWSNYDPQNYDPEVESITANNLADGWNLLSIPYDTSSAAPLAGTSPSEINSVSLSTYFPSAASNAFTYNGGYVSTTTLNYGPGFWLKFNGAQSMYHRSVQNLIDSVNVIPGWNIIGSVTRKLPVSSIASSVVGNIQSSFFGYNGAYYNADSIFPGQGYWVRVTSAGKLYYNATSFPPAKTSTQNVDLSNGFTKITVTDRAGKTQTLYTTDRPVDASLLNRYDLPPVPPSGAFDARFTTQRMVEVFPVESKSTRQLSVALQSNAYPLTISIDGAYAQALEVTEQQNGNAIGTQLLSTKNSISITNKDVNLITLKISDVKSLPQSFALSQNYPNPFNPTTRFTVDVPQESRVEVGVYDILGQKVATLMSGTLSSGSHVIEWNALNDRGLSVTSGMYFVRMNAGSFSSVRKMLLMK
jgi:hypothetical protein